ncbi:transmembrane protein 45B-like [Ylistrum balloti]|uniref:transmembrane protein 45B-like n=1 Tax=Ylistrum balloti TaxID=509963 RepID=UPI002905E828|nr:transmembrane protein 45B-like [Ylistrum balloti]XP_060064247.1 transmembrane protein 45B-like [Ylistrum balloti]
MDIPLVLSGCYFFPIGIWWLFQATKKFFYCKQRRIEFVSAISYPCCQSCQKWPVEGSLKLMSCLIIMAYCFASSTDFGRAGKITSYSDLSHGTVFAFFVICSAIDLTKSICGKLFLEDLDYAALALTFGVQGILYGFHVPDLHAEEWTVNTLMMMSAFGCCITVIVEMRMRTQIFCPLLRGFGLMVLGTWFLHSSLVLMDPLTIKGKVETHDMVISLSMFYSWHVAVNFILVICGWIITYKLMTLNKCCCVPMGMETGGDAIFLENRIRFDYHMLDRLDSDID